MKNVNEATYTMFHLSKFIMKGRERLYKCFLEHIDITEQVTLLDIGATSDRKNADSNFFIKKFFTRCKNITALSNENAQWLEEEFPGLTFLLGDGRNLPFGDNSFDLVFSNAVIEHVGSLEQQERFLLESYRVAKKYVFLTTPNRWYPIEFHTIIPFIHYLPKAWHRKILSFIGYSFFSKEENLNLLDKRTLTMLLEKNGITSYSVGTIPFFCLPSNIYVCIKKEE